MHTLEEFDNAKTKVLKYVLYKKRTEHETRIKFRGILEEEILEEVIEYLKEAKYIDDSEYINKTIKGFMALKALSLKELRYKLELKGINGTDIENYIDLHYNELYEYEKESASKLIAKKKNSMDEIALNKYLRQKGYNVGAHDCVQE